MMSSSSNFQKSCDVEMADAGGASLLAPPATGEVPAHIAEFLSFQSELARCDAEGSVNPTRTMPPRPVVPADALTPELKSKFSHRVPLRLRFVLSMQPAQESMSPPPAKRVFVLGLPAPSATPAAVPKSCKRPSDNPYAVKRKRCTEAGPLPIKASGSGLSSRHRAIVRFKQKTSLFLSVCVSIASSSPPFVLQFISLIDGIINKCGSDIKRLTKEFEELQLKSSQLEGKLKVIEDAHSLEEARFESRIAAIHVMDMALAGVEGGVDGGQHLFREAPLSPRTEETTLPIHRAELVDAEGDFDLILVGLKSGFILPSYLSEHVGQDPVAEDCIGNMAPNPEGAIGEDSRTLAKRQLFESRIRVFDTMPRDIRDQCAGFRVRPSLRYVLGLRDLYGRNRASLRGKF
uniref:Uncharacterized protein n=1 Tax=Brassica campestris TaxID=3711 RepID=M4F5M6_BRACM